MQAVTLPIDTTNFLTSTVQDYLRRAGMFTSLDITNLAKDAGYDVRNYQVADWLRRNVISIAVESSYMYNQSLITVDSRAVGVTKAYLYHHYMDDTDDYMDRDQNPQPSLSQLASTQLASPSRHSAIAPTTDIHFSSRELARDFARNHSNYRFVDQGAHLAKDGLRWSCVPR